MTRINVGVYWGSRRESVKECAYRFRTYLHSLTSFPVLADWYLKIEDFGVASSGPSIRELDDDVIEKLLIAGKSKYPNKDELGFRVGLWNKRNETESSSLSVSCGKFTTNTGLSNAVVLTVPRNVEVLSQDVEIALRRLLLLQVEAWSPEWGAVFSSNSDALKRRQGNGPFLDKILWLKQGVSVPETLSTERPVEDMLNGFLYVG